MCRYGVHGRAYTEREAGRTYMRKSENRRTDKRLKNSEEKRADTNVLLTLYTSADGGATWQEFSARPPTLCPAKINGMWNPIPSPRVAKPG